MGKAFVLATIYPSSTFMKAIGSPSKLVPIQKCLMKICKVEMMCNAYHLPIGFKCHQIPFLKLSHSSPIQRPTNQSIIFLTHHLYTTT
jgi:hypothetical protein